MFVTVFCFAFRCVVLVGELRPGTMLLPLSLKRVCRSGLLCGACSSDLKLRLPAWAVLCLIVIIFPPLSRRIGPVIHYHNARSEGYSHGAGIENPSGLFYPHFSRVSLCVLRKMGEGAL